MLLGVMESVCKFSSGEKEKKGTTYECDGCDEWTGEIPFDSCETDVFGTLNAFLRSFG